MTLIPWQGGKNVTWDVIVTDHVADSHLYLSAACAGSAAEEVASRKKTKYAGLDYSYTFIPLALETYGPINDKGTKFLQELGRHLRTISDDPRESALLRQRTKSVPECDRIPSLPRNGQPLKHELCLTWFLRNPCYSSTQLCDKL